MTLPLRILAGIALVALVLLVHTWDYREIQLQEQRAVECQK